MLKHIAWVFRTFPTTCPGFTMLMAVVGPATRIAAMIPHPSGPYVAVTLFCPSLAPIELINVHRALVACRSRVIPGTLSRWPACGLTLNCFAVMEAALLVEIPSAAKCPRAAHLL